MSGDGIVSAWDLVVWRFERSWTKAAARMVGYELRRRVLGRVGGVFGCERGGTIPVNYWCAYELRFQ